MENSKWERCACLDFNDEIHLDNCRVWTGYSQKDGYISKEKGSYGRINLVFEGRSLKFPTHRVSLVLHEILTLKPNFDFYKKEDKKLFFELYFAYSLSRLSVDHLCGNTLCFNPNHLEWVWMDKNQQRKKWKQKERSDRILKVYKSNTVHNLKLMCSHDVQTWINKIKLRRYRRKS
jgi:hypothetical protein